MLFCAEELRKHNHQHCLINFISSSSISSSAVC
jgi:hypothetical protein